jgi:hypothetical protein
MSARHTTVINCPPLFWFELLTWPYAGGILGLLSGACAFHQPMFLENRIVFSDKRDVLFDCTVGLWAGGDYGLRERPKFCEKKISEPKTQNNGI